MATETDKVSTGALGTLIAVGLFATLSIMLAVTALVRYSVHGVAAERADLAEQGYRDLRKAQTDKLSSSPTWTDKGQGKVSMPIDRAKAKVLSELAKDPSSATPPAPPPAASGQTAALAPSGAAVTTEGAAAPAGAEKPPSPAPTMAAAKPATPAPAAPAPKPTDG
jgi:hypothetical protein